MDKLNKYKCCGNINWHFVDIDMAYSPVEGRCEKCNKEFYESYEEERKKWCDEMNKDISMGFYKYEGGFHMKGDGL